MANLSFSRRKTACRAQGFRGSRVLAAAGRSVGARRAVDPELSFRRCLKLFCRSQVVPPAKPFWEVTMTKTRMNGSVGVAALLAAGLVFSAVPAGATSVGPRDKTQIGDSVDRRQVREHDQVRRQQVRQNEDKSTVRAFFGPLYEGKNSPWQRMKRAVD